MRRGLSLLHCRKRSVCSPKHSDSGMRQASTNCIAQWLFKDKGAIWYQGTDQAQNPYFGSTMLECADRVERIEHTAAPHQDRQKPESSDEMRLPSLGIEGRNIDHDRQSYPFLSREQTCRRAYRYCSHRLGRAGSPIRLESWDLAAQSRADGRNPRYRREPADHFHRMDGTLSSGR